LIIGLHEPAGFPVLNNFGGATTVDCDRWKPARHSLDEHKPELLAHRGQYLDVSGVHEFRQLAVIVPAGEKHIARPTGSDHVDRMLSFPLARMTTDEHEGNFAMRPTLSISESPDQQVQSLDLRVAARGE
jgi:hypothetical protein